MVWLDQYLPQARSNYLFPLISWNESKNDWDYPDKRQILIVASSLDFDATKKFIWNAEKNLAATKIDDTPEGVWCLSDIAKKIRENPINLHGNSKTSKKVTNYYKNQIKRELRKEKDQQAMIGAGN